jgi:predicted PurR-regulated permease PerM
VIFAAKSGLAEIRVLQQQWQALPGLGSEGESILSQLSHHPAVLKVIEKVTRFFPVQTEELLATVMDVLKVVGLKLGELLGVIVAKVPGMTLSVVVSMVSLYFFLVDGKKLTIFVKRNSFFAPAQTAELMTQLGVMARSVILASVASGVAQSVVMTLAMAVSSSNNVGMVAFLVFLCSFLPLVGSAPVTLFVTAGAFLKGDTQAGVILGAGAIAAGLVDNLVRPWVLKGGANLHPLLGFVAAFGGLQFFGLSGLFLGPIIAGLFVAVLRIQTRT